MPRYFEKIYDEDSKSEYYAYGTKRDYFLDRKNKDWEGTEFDFNDVDTNV